MTDHLAIAPQPAAPSKLAGEKIGIEANLPIDRLTGALNPQVRDPRVIADLGAGWARLNFVLGPWASPADETIHNGHDLERGLSGHCLGPARAIPEPVRSHRRRGHALRSGRPVPLPPQDGAAQDDWLDAYVANFVAIVEMFYVDFRAFELFNEPDDWHGQSRAWIHPGWFAIILQRVYAAVRERPHLDAVKVISGPLEGLEVSNNGAVTYLREVYRAGKRFYRMGSTGQAIPVRWRGLSHLCAAGIHIRPGYA